MANSASYDIENWCSNNTNKLLSSLEKELDRRSKMLINVETHFAQSELKCRVAGLTSCYEAERLKSTIEAGKSLVETTKKDVAEEKLRLKNK